MTELEAQYFDCRTEEVETSVVDSASMPRIQTVMMVSQDAPASSPQHASSSPDAHRYVITQDSDGNTTFVADTDEMFVQHHNNMTNGAALLYPVYAVTTNETIVDGSWSEQNFTAAGEEIYTEEPNNPTTTADLSEQTAEPNSPVASATRASPATVEWLLEHYEAAEGVSVPRSTLYAHYLRHCTLNDIDPVNAASFGKLIRAVFVGLRTRRLGTRGNSKYHYNGIRAKATSPLAASTAEASDAEPRAAKPSGAEMPAVQHLQFLGEAATPDLPDLRLTSPLSAGVCLEDIDAFKMIYREHCEAFIDSVGGLELAAVERLWREFWRRNESDEEEQFLSKATLFRVTSRNDVATWMRQVDIIVFQKAVEILLPDVLRPIPAALTQAVRNFAKALEGWSKAAVRVAPRPAALARRSAASAMAAALRRYTSLNHLAQAARAVLHNRVQIHQMLDDLHRVDFRNVREQAAWVCRCPAADQLEVDFKDLLGKGASLEQWASWLNETVTKTIPPGPTNTFSTRARRFLLDWSFYSSMVIRDLTLRSATSFGSFHLIRLLYDEYVFYLVEKRIAENTNRPPISVLHQELYEELNTESNTDTEEKMDDNFDDSDISSDSQDQPPSSKRNKSEEAH